MRVRPLVPALLAASLALTTASPALGDEWPMFRHDRERTASSAAQVSIERPAVLFRTYLGGSLRATQVADVDVDGDGRSEIVYVSGGRVVAKRGNNVALWESEILPVDTLWGLVDLDRDGELEILLSRSRPIPAALVVVSARDGAVRWRMPDGVADWIGGLSIGDLDGDGNDDLFTGSGICGTGVTAPSGTAFSFCSGGACGYDRARVLWTLGGGAQTGNCGNGGVIGDVTGDGRSEIIVPWEYDELPIYDGATGARIGALADFPSGDYDRSAASLVLAQLDDDPALELVSHVDHFNGGRGARRLAVHDFRGGAFVTLWEVALTDRARDRVLWDAPGGIADLDGDGDVEVVVGRYVAAEARWSTTVHDALTGAVLATLDGTVLRGVADVIGDPRPEILVERAGTLEAHALVGAALERRFELPARQVVRVGDAALRPRALQATRVLTMQLDDDPTPELVVGEAGEGGIVALHAYDTDVSPPAPLGVLRAPSGSTVLATALLGPTTRDFAQLGVATSDGYFLVLDRALAVTNRALGEFPEPGMRVGGYYTGPGGQSAAPIAATFPDGPSILVADSRGALLRLDASAASAATPPVTRDLVQGARFPSVIELDGVAPRELVVVQGRDVVVRDAAPGLAVRWRSSELVSGNLFTDALPATLGGGARALVGTGYDTTGDWVAYALDARTGATLWRTPTPRLLGWGTGNQGLHAVGELTGDAVDDLACVVNGAVVVDGASPTEVRTYGSFMARGAVMLADVEGDAGLELFAHGSYQPARAVGRDGGVRWTWEPRMALDSYAAEVRCGGQAAFVGGAFGSAELWTVRASDGAELAHRVLAGGATYAPGAVPAAVRAGSLGNVVAVAPAAGGARVLAGSSDGWLYAVDPCTLEHRWAIDLRYPVGEPIAADVDGDGDDEVVVSVADGHLYGITDGAYDAPRVRDVLPGAPGTDVDEVEASDTLHAAWDPVPGATSYLVSVYTAQGSEVRFPNARDVGAVTEVAIPMLPLVVGGRYAVAVQPIGPAGPGLEGRSDGATVVDLSPADASIEVTPRASWPPFGVSPSVRALCVDRIGTERLESWVQAGSGERIASLDDRPGAGQRSVSSTVSWDGVPEGGGAVVAPGLYVAVVRCVDLAGRESRAETTFVLDPDALADGGALDGGSSPPRGAPSEGCGCRAAGAPAEGRGALMAAAALLVALARRRRRAC